MGVHTYIDDLKDWYGDIEEKDKSIKEGKLKAADKKDLPPIRDTSLQDQLIPGKQWVKSEKDVFVEKAIKMR